MGNKTLSVIVPIYNERDTCHEIIHQIKKNPIDKQIIVIDDGSTDGSPDILKTIDGIVLIQHNQNLGKGTAVISGLKQASGDYVILQDGDLEYDPQDYVKLLQPLIDGNADAVFGSRWLHQKNRFTFHYIINRSLTIFSNILNGAHLTDVATCYKIMSRDLFKSLELKSRGFGIDTEITAKLFKKNYRVVEVPISYVSRTIREGKKIKWWDRFILVWSCIRFRFFD